MNLSRFLSATALCTVALTAHSADTEVSLVIHEHRFEPEELVVPAGQKIKLIVHNKDATAEEFESHELNREKVIPAGAKATIFVGPLSPGSYPFFGEFNPKTARGKIIAK
jgi:plastocyanin